jgi:membrane protein required for colicin V production
MTVTPTTWLDVAILAVVALAAALGVMKGLVRGVFSLLAIPVAIAVAFRGYRPLGVWLHNVIRNETLTLVLAFCLLLVGTAVVVILIGTSVRTLAVKMRLGWFDRILGLVLGLAKGILISGLAVWLALGLFPSARRLVDRSSWGVPVVSVARTVVGAVATHIPRLLEAPGGEAVEAETA